MKLCPSLFCLFLCLLYFFLPPFEELGCFSGCLMSSASIQKLFCEIYSVFKCSFDEFVEEKVFSPSYSSTILAPPLVPSFCQRRLYGILLRVLYSYLIFTQRRKPESSLLPSLQQEKKSWTNCNSKDFLDPSEILSQQSKKLTQNL